MMDWMLENLVESLLIIGLLLLAIEILVLGFSTFVLFFIGLASIATAGIIYMGLIPDSFLSALMSLSVFSTLFALLLWRPLKKMQTKVDTKQADNDLVGHSFVIDQAVSPNTPGKYRYSGIDWSLRSSESIDAGSLVEVTRTEVGVFHIQPKPNLA
jgi:membrane protein implicated in regulation of membrane protease activity